MKLRPATVADAQTLKNAIIALKAARTLAKSADCPKLTAKIRSALKSAGGAWRHIERRINGR